MRPYAGRTPATSPAPGDACLLLLQNKTGDSLHALGRMLTPRGASFLDEAVYDLEVGGLCAFVASASNDLMLLLPGGAHRLTLKGSELRLQPGGGMKQRLALAPPGSPHRWVLSVDVESSAPSYEHVLPSLENLLAQQATAGEVRGLFEGARYPCPCTVLLPRARPALVASWERLVIPEALFFVERRAGEATAADGARVRISPHGRTHILFTVESPDDQAVQAPLVLRAEATPLRCSERWQLIYICD